MSLHIEMCRLLKTFQNKTTDMSAPSGLFLALCCVILVLGEPVWTLTLQCISTIWQVVIFMKDDRSWLNQPWLTPAFTIDWLIQSSYFNPFYNCLWLWNDQISVGHSWKRAPYLASTSPPSFLLFPFHLLSYVVINQIIFLFSVMCLNVQGGNERILSPSSALQCLSFKYTISSLQHWQYWASALTMW